MMGKREATGTLFEVGNIFALELPPDSFHGQLAPEASRLFQDEQFATFYHARRGRLGVPPSELALLLLLQAEAGCSDAEAIARSAFDLRWCAVLGKEAGRPLCAKSTFQEFRGQIVLHESADAVLRTSIDAAKRAGLLKGRTLRIAIDTKPIIGRGAVLDTYNLLGAGIEKLGRALADAAGQTAEHWAREQDLRRYFGDRSTSLKGSAEIDWTDAKARQVFLEEIVVDARRVLRLAASYVSSLPAVRSAATAKQERRVQEARELLDRLLSQDIDETPAADGPAQAEIREGTAPDRVPSATDPEQRHGRKSKKKRFTGHKLRIGVDVETGLIGSVEVLAGSAGDAEHPLAAVEQVEANTEMHVDESLGDCAYGGGETRREFAEAGRSLIAKVPQPATNGTFFPKSAFHIDLEAGTVTCPQGHTTAAFHEDKKGHRTFQFGEFCPDCPLRDQCTKSAQGRTLQVHAQEALLTAAREFQQTEAGQAKLRERTKVEHALARMAQRGVGQAKYCGREKTRVQMVLAAAVVNLRWVFNRTRGKPPEGTTETGGRHRGLPPGSAARAHGSGEAGNKTQLEAGGQKSTDQPGIRTWIARLLATSGWAAALALPARNGRLLCWLHWSTVGPA